MLLKALLSGSKELGFGIVILELIHGFIQKSPLNVLSSPELRLSIQESLYRLLPSKWKAPTGPVTLPEFNLVLELGLDFYNAIRALFQRN